MKKRGASVATQTDVALTPADPSREKVPVPATASKERTPGSSHHQGRAKRVPTIPELFSPILSSIIFLRLY